MASLDGLEQETASSCPLPKVYLHPSPRETLLPHLLPLLPYTIPVVRRIQYHLQTPYAQVLSTLSPDSQPHGRQTSQNPSLSTNETSIPPLSTSYTEPPGRMSSDANPRNHTVPSDLPSEGTLQSANPSISTNETAIPPLPTVPRPAKHFAAAYIDRSRCPETEAWIFSTLELPPSSSPSESSEDEARLQIPALWVHHLSTLTPQVQADIRQASDIEPSHNLTNILCGTTHRLTLQVLHSGPVRNEDAKHALTGVDVQESADGKVVRGHTPTNTKFLIPPANLGKGNTELPAGLEWAGQGLGRDLDEEDIQLVVSLADIPRRAATMLLLPRLGIRIAAAHTPTDDANGMLEPGTLIAWAFLGQDASLTTLHVQPSHRRRGLAQKIARKLFTQVAASPNPMLGVTAGTKLKLQQKAYEGLGVGREWNHADVLFDNEPSAGAMRAVGGRAAWEVFWAVVDLERLGSSVEGTGKG